MPKEKKVSCANCKGKDFFEVDSCPRDGSCLTYKGETKDGYLPKLSGISHFEDISMKVCVGCGCIYGFDKEQIKKDLANAFEE